MTFALVNLILWPALLLGLLPLLIHLFARSKPPKYRFSSLEFILRIVRDTMRLKRPKDWLLLLVRTLLVLLLILMFLRPLFFSQHRLAGHALKKNVVLIVDATASMAYVDGAQTRFAAACAEASEVLAGLSANDAANIVWLDSSPDSAFPDLGPNIGYLRNALRKAQVSNEAGDIDEAVHMGIEMIVDEEGKNEICILSDFQKSAWEDADIRVPEGVDLIRIKVGGTTAANGAVVDIGCTPSTPLVGERISIFCEVQNYSPRPRRRTVFLQAGESRQSQSLLIAPWSRSTATFEYTFKDPGQFPVKAELDEDSYAGDDQRTELLGVKSHLNVAVLKGDGPTTAIWMRALDALEWAKAVNITPKDLGDGATFDVLIMPDWDGENIEAVRRSLENCSIAFCAPAPGIAGERLADLVQAKTEDHLGPLKQIKFDEPVGARLCDHRDPAFQIFADGEYGDPVQADFKIRLNLPRALTQHGDTLVAYDDGAPGLVRFEGSGDLLFWNLSLDPQQSDWASRVGFLPFIAELMLASRRDRDTRLRHSLYPGGRAVWHLESDLPASEIELKGPAAASVPIESQPGGEGVDFVSGPLAQMGLYTWEHNSQPTRFDVVNFPVVESDLRGMAVGELKRDDAVAVERGSDVRQLRDGIKLWPWLLALAFCMGMAEMGILFWAGQR